MPTYTYRCTSCEHQFDQFQKFSEDPLTECPQCHGQLRKVFQPVGVVFKGSGWYINDSRKPESSSSTEKSGDKPAEKTADKPAPAAKSESSDTKAAAPAAAD